MLLPYLNRVILPTSSLSRSLSSRPVTSGRRLVGGYGTRHFHWSTAVLGELRKDSTPLQPTVTCFFHENTNSCTYIVEDHESNECAIIDPVLDFDYSSVRTWTETADRYVYYIKDKGLKNKFILETHCHADHITAATYLKKKIGGQIGIGKNIKTVQKVFAKIFNFNSSIFNEDGFDLLLDETSTLKIGNIDLSIVETPGHTPACISYVIGDAVFVGDTIFMPDYGCARCDFPGGSAEHLYNSVMNKLYQLPDHYRVFVCHDYLPENRKKYEWETTIEEEKKRNIWLNKNVQLEDFVKRRNARDSQLAAPKLLYPSIQFNLRSGVPPPPEENGRSFIKIPIPVAK